MAERISASPVRYPFSFVIAGDSGAWPDPTADAIFAQLCRRASTGASQLASGTHVEITVTERRPISGRVLQAFDPVDGHARFQF